MEESKANNNKALFVGEGVTLEGKIIAQGAVEVHGLIKGELHADSALIGVSGRVEGVITTNSLEISGCASSNISVSDKLVIRGGGVVEGDISYGTLQIDAGASIFGNLRKAAQTEGGLLRTAPVLVDTVSTDSSEESEQA